VRFFTTPLSTVPSWQVLQQRLAFRRCTRPRRRTPRHDHVVALLVELDDLELERLPSSSAGSRNRPHIDERARQERADQLDVDREAAAHAAADHARDDSPFWKASSRRVPSARALRLLARQTRLAEAVSTVSSATSTMSPTLDVELAALVEN
jgi:hypothetical protein